MRATGKHFSVVVLLATACHASATGSARPRPPVAVITAADFVQFRWVDTTRTVASGGYMDVMRSRIYALSDTVVLDINGIDSASTHKNPFGTDSWDVNLLLSRSGAAQFGATTAMHTGRRLAILVDGRIVNAPTVTSAIGPHAQLVSGVTRAVADSLALRVNHAAEQLGRYRPVTIMRSPP